MSFDIHLTIQRIKEEAEKNDTSLNQFLINNSLPQHLVDNMKRGRIPSIETIYNFAEKANCSVDYLLGLTDVEKINSEPTSIYRFPVFKQEAAAGVGRLDVNDAYYMEDYVVDNIPDEAVFIMKIAGDSMYNEKTNQIKNNAIVVINPKETLFEDKIVIVNLDGEIVCKRYSKVDDHVEFKSDNESCQNENKDSRNYRDPKVIGVVLGVIENQKFILVK